MGLFVGRGEYAGERNAGALLCATSVVLRVSVVKIPMKRATTEGTEIAQRRTEMFSLLTRARADRFICFE